MKVIIPVAGEGTRLRPHTLTRPKPLLDCAGKTIIDHVLKPLESIVVDELIFVIGFLGEQIEEYILKNYDYKCRFIRQEELLGLGYALNLAMKEMENSELLIILGDTIVDCDFKLFTKTGDYVLGVRQVDDPHRFGIAELKGDYVVGLEEKPADPKSNLALIGLYYFKESNLLKEILQKHIDSGKLTSGEIQFTDALQGMLSNGIEFTPYELHQWYDCGTRKTLLETNKVYLKSNAVTDIDLPNTEIIQPVYISKTAEVSNSKIGPNVSIGEKVIVENSELSDSIISDKAIIKNSKLHNSIIGRKAQVENVEQELDIGDKYKIIK